jgi:hypothetical protein
MQVLFYAKSFIMIDRVFFITGIGSRFALMEAKACIFYLMSKLKFCVCEKTVDKVEFECTVPPILKTPIYVELKMR